jgi:hypothetical protein
LLLLLLEWSLWDLARLSLCLLKLWLDLALEHLWELLHFFRDGEDKFSQLLLLRWGESSLVSCVEARWWYWLLHSAAYCRERLHERYSLLF